MAPTDVVVVVAGVSIVIVVGIIGIVVVVFGVVVIRLVAVVAVRLNGKQDEGRTWCCRLVCALYS